MPQTPPPFPISQPDGPEWQTAPGRVAYEDADAFMQDRVRAIHEGAARECIWLLEHPPLYTAGTSADASELVAPDRFPVFQTGRGGRHTYHGPGQRVAYVMLDLKRRGEDVRAYVRHLEEWAIQTLAAFDVVGERREGRIGIWVVMPDGAEKKIVAIGVRIRHWVTFHGMAINVSPNLEHYSGIVPCGISDFGVTSLHDLGIHATMEDVDRALKDSFVRTFGT